MELKNQVCPLEYSKKLLELGIDEPAQFYWMEYGLSPEKNKVVIYDALDIKGRLLISLKTLDPTYGCFPAFTVSELGVMLDGAAVSEMNIRGKWEAWPPRYVDTDVDIAFSFKCDTEANCRAMALLHLIECGVLSIEATNKRLKA